MEAREQLRNEPRYTAPAAPSITAAARRREDTRRYLVEQRVIPTVLDGLVAALPVGEDSTKKHVADALFRAGMRTQADVAARPIDRLFMLPGIGPKSEPVVRALANQLGASG